MTPWKFELEGKTDELRPVAAEYITKPQLRLSKDCYRNENPALRLSEGRVYREGTYSSTKIFFFAHISFSTFGHTVTLTSPRCAFRSRDIKVRDCPIPPPIDSGI